MTVYGGAALDDDARMLWLRRAAPAVFAAVFVSAAAPGPAAGAASDPTERCLTAYEQAQRLSKRKELVAARAELVQCGQPSCPAQIVRECGGWLADVERALPSIVVEVVADGERQTDVRVLSDGEELAPRLSGAALTLDPGERELVVILADGRRAAQRVVLLEGEKARRVRFDLDPPPHPARAERDMVPVWVLGGVSVIALGSFTAFALSSHAKRDDLERCRGHCSADAVDEVRREQIVADVSLTVAVLSAGAATYFWLRPLPGVAVGAAAAPGGASLSLRGAL